MMKKMIFLLQTALNTSVGTMDTIASNLTVCFSFLLEIPIQTNVLEYILLSINFQ